jgi:hypothetical protein
MGATRRIARAGVVSLSAVVMAGCSLLPRAEFDFGSRPGPTTAATEAPTQEAPAPVPPPTAEATPPSEPVDPPSTAPQGGPACLVDDITGQTANAPLQETATWVFNSLDCQSTESLETQLRRLSASPELTRRVDEAWWDLNLDKSRDSSNMVSVTLYISDFDDTGASCGVSVSEVPRMKMMLCMDDAPLAPAPVA